MPNRSIVSKHIFLCFLLVLIGSNPTVNAVEVKDLYLVKWPVNEQSKTARWKAALAGFKEVLVRKSGSKQILDDQGVQKAYRKVTNYLRRFEYIRQVEEQSEFQYLISLYFEPRLIDSLIKDAKMSLWGSNRPLTVLWLATEDSAQRKIINATSTGEIFTQVEESALRRGLPIIAPLMDLEDELAVTVSDVWGRFSTVINQASQRYSADSVLIGRIQAIGEQWRGQFTYINQGLESGFEIEADSQTAVVEEMTDKLADILCNKYCVVEEVGQKNEIILYLSAVSSFASYKNAEKYLTNLSATQSLKLLGIEDQTLKLKIALFGSLESLIEGIRLSSQMVAVEPIKRKLSENVEQLVNEQSGFDSGSGSELELIDVATEIETFNSEKADLRLTKELPILYYRWNG